MQVRRVREIAPRQRALCQVLLGLVLTGVPAQVSAANYGFLVGYAVQETAGACDPSLAPTNDMIQPPLFKPFNRNNQQWWSNLVEEAAFSNVPFIALNFRGDSPCGQFPPVGGEPTSFATNAVNAINARGYSGFMKLALFDDIPSASGHLEACTGVTSFNLGDSSLWGPYIWETRWRPFFDRVPDNLRMKISGRPLVFIWSVAPGLGFTGHSGNLAWLISYLRGQAIQTYGFDPFIVVDQSWVQLDPSVGGWVDGVNNWFGVASGGGTSWSKRTHAGYAGRSVKVGIVNPGFYLENGSTYMFTDRAGGATLTNGLANTASQEIVLLEGITDSEENAGYYRGSTANYPNCGGNPRPAGQAWSFPNQYLNLVREYSAPFAKYIVYEAEAADTFSTFATAPAALYRRDGNLDISYTNPGQSNWAVRLKSNNWLQFNSFQLGSSSIYKVSLTYSSQASAQVELLIDGVTKVVFTAPTTGGFTAFQTLAIPTTFTASAARHNVRLRVASGDIKVDSWTLNGLF